MQERRRVLFGEKKGYSSEYLTFKALESGTFSFSYTVNYSTDDGTTWTYLSANTNSPTINSGSKIMWKAPLVPNYGIGTFSSTGNFEVEGNPMSLLYSDNFKGQVDLSGKDFAFYSLFSGCTRMISAEKLSLPATTLTGFCYTNMFNGCTSLTSIPSDLLPATTLAQSCYSGMFNGCTSLTTVPELPATTLAQNCYGDMFNGCKNLTTTPVLSATTLAAQCYQSMFSGCTSLTTAPVLPATTLANYCYSNMFYGCTSLNYIKAMFTTTPSVFYTPQWVNGVASSGTFVKNSTATWNNISIDGVPDGWTVQYA